MGTKNLNNMKTLHFITWIIFFLMPRCAPQSIIYIRRLKGESVDIRCVPEKELHPFGLYLRYRFPQPERNVAFFSAFNHTVDHQYEGRVSIHGTVATGPINVTLSGLQVSDTGVYACSFEYSNSSVGQVEQNSTQVFVFVETPGMRCTCLKYPILLYTISGLVALLLLLVLIVGSVKLIQGIKCSCDEEISPVPIYEEMRGKNPASSQNHQLSVQECGRSLMPDGNTSGL